MRIVTLRSSSSAPQIASLTFMRGEEPLQRLEFPAGAEIRVRFQSWSVLRTTLGRTRHFTIPTAFIVAPRSASALPINFAHSSGPSQITPTPRWVLNPLYSLLEAVFLIAATILF